MTLAPLIAAWLTGLLVGFQVDAAPLPLFLLALSSVPLGLLLRFNRFPTWPVVMAGLLLLGFWHVELSETSKPKLVQNEKQQVQLQGRIANDPEATSRRIKFELDAAEIDRGNGWQNVTGRALVYADPPNALVDSRPAPYFRHGDTVQVDGILQRPPKLETFDYPAYLERQGISGLVWSRQAEFLSQDNGRRWRGWIFDLRHRLSDSLETSLPLPASSLAQAMLLGLREQLPGGVTEEFRGTGTSHLLAISGLHVGTLLIMSLGLATWLIGRQRRTYLLLPLALMWMYALISGLPPSVIRAAIMGSMYLAALALGRPQITLAALALAAAVMTVANPQIVRQVSFQLSFAAMAGIVLALPYPALIIGVMSSKAGSWSRAWQWPPVRWLISALIISVAATLATLPLVAFTFHRIPVFGIPATILVLPVLPTLLAGSLLTAVGGLIHPLLGEFLGWMVWPSLAYVLKLVELFPAKTLSGEWVSAPMVWVWYICLVGILVLGQRWKSSSVLIGRAWNLAKSLTFADGGGLISSRLTMGCMVVSFIAIFSGVILWAQILGGPDGQLHVNFFDVGQGDSILIVSPSGRQALIDGGPDTDSATLALSAALPARDRSLDLVFLTHIDSDHSLGLLEVLERYEVGAVLVGTVDEKGPVFPRWRNALDRMDLKPIQVSAGYRIVLDEGVILEVLHPPPTPVPGLGGDRNNRGLVLRLVYEDTTLLLTADIEAEAERYLLGSSQDLESEALKVAHHGSKTSSTEEFLARVSPSMAIISAGADNRYGHPHAEVVARLNQTVGEGAVYQTATQGKIELISDGNGWEVLTQSPSEAAMPATKEERP